MPFGQFSVLKYNDGSVKVLLFFKSLKVTLAVCFSFIKLTYAHLRYVTIQIFILHVLEELCLFQGVYTSAFKTH